MLPILWDFAGIKGLLKNKTQNRCNLLRGNFKYLCWDQVRTRCFCRVEIVKQLLDTRNSEFYLRYWASWLTFYIREGLSGSLVNWEVYREFRASATSVGSLRSLSSENWNIALTRLFSASYTSKTSFFFFLLYCR